MRPGGGTGKSKTQISNFKENSNSNLQKTPGKVTGWPHGVTPRAREAGINARHSLMEVEGAMGDLRFEDYQRDDLSSLFKSGDPATAGPHQGSRLRPMEIQGEAEAGRIRGLTTGKN
jgi:hypothetical protein